MDAGPNGERDVDNDDPDADPEMLQEQRGRQPDQAEGEDDRSEQD